MRPARQPAAVINRIGAGPIDFVAAVEIDPMDTVSALGQRLPQLREERTGKSLEEEEFSASHASHLSPVASGAQRTARARSLHADCNGHNRPPNAPSRAKGNRWPSRNIVAERSKVIIAWRP